MSRRSRSGLVKMLATASLFALLPLAAASAAPAPASTGFCPPSGPLILTRTLRRPLPDGAEIVSIRSYEVRIVSEGEGFRVEGSLLSSEVKAPPALSVLAAIERQRSDSGLFPFYLDRDGMIASAAGPTSRIAVEAAVAAAKNTIAGIALPEAERGEANAVVDQLATRRAATGARWPNDLFHPAPGTRSQTRQFDLGEGKTGSVTTTIEAHRDGAAQSIERTVVTETAGVRRSTHETYTVAPRQG